MKPPMVCALVLGALLVSTAVRAEPADAQAPQAGAVERSAGRSAAPEVYRIGPEDMLQISVWKNDAMTRTVPVRPDGKISLPLLNDVQAAGLTPLELRDALTQRLAEYMPQPEVSVIVAEVRSFKVSVMGEVAHPARYELKSWTTVLDALALAGGFTQFAVRSRIVILRPDGTTVRRIPFNYNKLIASEGLLDKILNAGSDDQGNLYLQNGDIVLVP